MASRPMRCVNLRAPSPAAGALAGCNASDIGHGWAYRWDYSWQLSRWCQTYYEQAGARRSTQPGRSTRLPARPAPGGSARPERATQRAAWDAVGRSR
jgi:hypothetical protein